MLYRNKLNKIVEIKREDYNSNTEYYKVLLDQKEINFIPKEVNMKDKFENIIKKYLK
tara:strand:- start:215 stop:385 length:171 start_codon:yes stop_codon:yes gene_type:complete